MKILYCTDFTEAALYSLEKAIPFLKPDCKMDIISVIEVDFLTNLGGHPSAYVDYLQMCKENKLKELEKTKPIIRENGIIIDKILYPKGYSADEILSQIKKENYSMVISGSRSKLTFGKWLGSTSRKLAEKSHIPVFIARKKENATVMTSKKRVLFAVDGTENSYNSIKRTIDIMNFKKTIVEVIHVKRGKESLPPEVLSDKVWLETILQKEQELSNEILERASDIAEKNGVKIDSKKTLEGSPIEEILSYTEKNEKELVVMGSHGREGLSSLLLGSVSKGILDNTYCPVLIIPTKKPELLNS